NTPNTLIPIPRMALAPDSPLARRSDRHPITEAGFETVLDKLSKTIEENQAGDTSHGRISYAGLAQPERLDHACHKLLRLTPAAAARDGAPVSPAPDTQPPALVQASASRGDPLSPYCFHEAAPPPAELAAAGAFDPNRRWGQPKGIVARLAGGALNTGAEPAP